MRAVQRCFCLHTKHLPRAPGTRFLWRSSPPVPIPVGPTWPNTPSVPTKEVRTWPTPGGLGLRLEGPSQLKGPRVDGQLDGIPVLKNLLDGSVKESDLFDHSLFDGYTTRTL